jgi:nitroreductase
MEFRELARARYSCRAYRSDPVEEAKLQLVLEAAQVAPTAANRQAFRIYVLPTRGRREDLARVYGRDWFFQAPLVIGIAGVPRANWVRRDGRNYVDVDCAIVMDHLILQAADLGLGTCWIAAFDPDAARAVLGLPPDEEPIALTPLGYPADAPAEKIRKPLAELVVRRP